MTDRDIELRHFTTSTGQDVVNGRKISLLSECHSQGNKSVTSSISESHSTCDNSTPSHQEFDEFVTAPTSVSHSHADQSAASSGGSAPRRPDSSVTASVLEPHNIPIRCDTGNTSIPHDSARKSSTNRKLKLETANLGDAAKSARHYAIYEVDKCNKRSQKSMTFSDETKAMSSHPTDNSLETKVPHNIQFACAAERTYGSHNSARKSSTATSALDYLFFLGTSSHISRRQFPTCSYNPSFNQSHFPRNIISKVQMSNIENPNRYPEHGMKSVSQGLLKATGETESVKYETVNEIEVAKTVKFERTNLGDAAKSVRYHSIYKADKFNKTAQKSTIVSDETKEISLQQRHSSLKTNVEFLKDKNNSAQSRNSKKSAKSQKSNHSNTKNNSNSNINDFSNNNINDPPKRNKSQNNDDNNDDPNEASENEDTLDDVDSSTIPEDSLTNADNFTSPEGSVDNVVSSVSPEDSSATTRSSTSLEDSSANTEGSESPEGSTTSDENQTTDTIDSSEMKDSPSSSPSSPDEGGEKKKKKKLKKRPGVFMKFLKSSPEEHYLLKAILWFPIGIGLSVGLYFLIIRKINLAEKYKLMIGCGLGLFLALLFALSIQMRCIMTLAIPTFVGKAGRSYFAAFAIVYLVNGPITNIMDNCKEIVRSMTCNGELTSNHTRAKYMLKMHPLEFALKDLMKDNFVVVKASKAIKRAFSPVSKEIKENKLEDQENAASIRKVEKMGGKKSSVVDSINSQYKDKDDKEAGKKVEKKWEKKNELRCQSTFSNGVQRCRDKMYELERKCMRKLSFIGHMVCWPLKITVFCELVRLLPGVVGLDCNAAAQVSPGFGDTYLTAQEVQDDMDSGAKVNMQYKIVGSADANYMPVEELRKATMHEVQEKTDTVNLSLNIITNLLAFTFLLVFYGAYKYNIKYLTDLNWDNKYITRYFRHIDARRKAQGKKTLLPLKKSEKKELYDPSNIKLSVAEKKSFIKGTIKLLLRVVVTAVICYMDSMFYQVLDIIARNSKIEYHQTGEHVIDIKVYGKGFMSALVGSFLERFNTKADLDSVSTNHQCLPRPSQTDVLVLCAVFGTYFLVWVFMLFEAFGLRMRRVIASFYYRKREKKRVLYLYNERYRRRTGFLMHMRAKVRKQLRDREFKKKIGFFMALKLSLGVDESFQRQFPFMAKCLSFIKSTKDTCIICGDPETKGFYTCPTEGCGVGYCRECWIDIKKKCYACGQAGESEDESDDEAETQDESDKSSEDSE